MTGLAAMLVPGCAGGSGQATPTAGPTTAGPTTRAPDGFDPSAYTPPQLPIDELKKLFAYPNQGTLGVTLTTEDRSAALVVEDVTYDDTKGSRVAAYILTVPKPVGRQPGLLLAHDAASDRESWLAEGKELAMRGMTVVITQLPFVPTGDPARDSATIVNSVVAQRRAFDLIARRADTDPARLAVVGNGWGSAQAQILSAVDARMVAVGALAASGRISKSLMVSVKPTDPRAYMDSLTRFDGARYLAAAAKRQVLFQFGKQDRTAPADQFEEAVTVTSGTRERHDYEAGHNLITVADAAAERLAFLKRVLRLK